MTLSGLVAHILGLLLIALGLVMLVPAALDLWLDQGAAGVFLTAGFMTAGCGTLIALATAHDQGHALSLRESFLLTTLTWVVLPAFGALPLFLALPDISPTDALFESLSGMTTTGTTVLVGLDDLPAALLLWRSLLQWLGGLGIVIVALIFLPVMQVGGMQHFRSEGFDTMGKVMPRVAEISRMLLQIYIALTVLCALAFAMAGMGPLDAINHALATIATGGYSTRDASMAAFGPAVHYVCALFMWLAGLPFIRYVQLVNGSVQPLFRDIQVRAYLRWTLYAIAAIMIYRIATSDAPLEQVFRETVLNVISLFSGTGFGSAEVSAWGDFPLLVVMVAGFIGACTASTGCSIKVFRFLVLFAAIRAQIRLLVHPNRVLPIRLDGRKVADDVVTSVIVMFSAFVLCFAVLAALLTLTGLEMRSAITAAWTAICNVGPVYGPGVGATGAVDAFPDAAKWLMMVGMLLGRLEIVAVLVLILPRFWRG